MRQIPRNPVNGKPLLTRKSIEDLEFYGYIYQADFDVYRVSATGANAWHLFTKSYLEETSDE